MGMDLTASLSFGVDREKLRFSDDFEKGSANWETTDAKAWRLAKADGNQVFGLKQRKSDYAPEHRSPLNIALIKDIALEDFVLTYRVKSTLDTGNHRDCCTFCPDSPPYSTLKSPVKASQCWKQKHCFLQRCWVFVKDPSSSESAHHSPGQRCREHPNTPSLK